MDELKLQESIVSTESIPFNLSTVSESIIRKDYLGDYTIFKELDDAERRLERRVNDSLDVLENILNKQECKRTLSKSYRNVENPQFVIFFSCCQDNQLYAEVLPYYGTTRGRLPGFGNAETFYFVFDQRGSLKRVYKGSVTHN